MQGFLRAPSADRVGEAARAAAALLPTDPKRAESAIMAVLETAPNDPRALLILGSAYRRQSREGAALEVLEPLARRYPRAANTQYELGAALSGLGRLSDAIEALRRAVAINPELSAAWGLLGDALAAEGAAVEAEHAYRRLRCAGVSDPELKPIIQNLYEGDHAAGEQALRAFLLQRPRHPEALRQLADFSAERQQHGTAELLFRQALALDQTDAEARFGLATALVRQQKAVEALRQAKFLLQRSPRNLAYLNLLAACHGLLGETERAITIYEELSRLLPRHAGIWLNFGHALRTVGRRDEAVEAYRTCLQHSPTNGEAYWSIANLKVVSFSEVDIARMQAQLDSAAASENDLLHMQYALGKAFEDAREYARSFHHYAAGARLRRGRIVYSAEETSAFTRRAMQVFTPQFFEARQGCGSQSNAPIFIIGLPRAGSTLVEQILASHTAVEGTMELPEIPLLARRLGGAEGDSPNTAYPQVLETLSHDRFVEAGCQYLADTLAYRRLRSARFVDKMPNNFQHVGLIHLILPHAKIIDVRRSPMASCFAAFKQHFNQGQTFSYDLGDLGRYYADYVDLMEHFDQVIPGVVHRLVYEDLVNDTEETIRRLLNFCDLPFEANCLSFYESRRAVRTVSSEQVRRPIFRDGLDQWRRYEAYLQPLKAALGRCADEPAMAAVKTQPKG